MLAVQYGHTAVVKQLLNCVPVPVVLGTSAAAVYARKRTDINTQDKVPYEPYIKCSRRQLFIMIIFVVMSYKNIVYIYEYHMLTLIINRICKFNYERRNYFYTITKFYCTLITVSMIDAYD